MSEQLPSLGEVEIAILRLVWEYEPCTERRISDLIQDNRDVTRTTVLKTMQGLEAEGLLKRRTMYVGQNTTQGALVFRNLCRSEFI